MPSDDPLLRQRGDCGVVETQLAVNFAIMLADLRRPPPNRDRLRAESCEWSRTGQRDAARMLDFTPEVAGLELRILEQLLDRRNRRDQDTMFARDLEQLRLGALGEELRDHRQIFLVI